MIVLIRELGLCIAARVMRRNETHSPHRTYMNGENIGVRIGYYSHPPCNVDLNTEQGPGASNNKGIPTTRKIYQTPFATANMRAEKAERERATS